MGRPSKLTDKQWGEIGRRLASGEPTNALAREYKVSKATVSEQCSVISLVDQMKGIQNDYAVSAANGAKTSAHLTGIAQRKAAKLTDDVETEDLRTIAALAETANKSLVPASNLIAANKPKEQAAAGGLESLIAGSWEGK